MSKGDTFPPSSTSAGPRSLNYNREEPSKLHGILWPHAQCCNSHPIALAHPLHKPAPITLLGATHAAIPPHPHPPASPMGQGMGPGCLFPALSGHLVVPTGLSPPSLPTTHTFPPLPLPLPFCACCTKDALDLNLSARIRVWSCCSPPSTEPRQGCGDTSATVGYSPGASCCSHRGTEVRRGSNGCTAPEMPLLDSSRQRQCPVKLSLLGRWKRKRKG